MKTAHRQAAKGKPRYADDFPSEEPEQQDDDDSEPEQQEQEQ